MRWPFNFLRYLLPLVVVVLAALLLGNTLRSYWIRAFVDKRSFTSALGWLSPSWLALTWGYELLLAFMASIVLALILPREHRSAWIVGMGVAIAGLRFLTVQDYTSLGADFTLYGWIYGGYLMPVVGATLGAAVVHQFHRIREQKP